MHCHKRRYPNGCDDRCASQSSWGKIGYAGSSFQSCANRGEPVVRLVPTSQKSANDFIPGSAEAILSWRKDFPLPPYLQRSAEEINQMIIDERAA